jgi:hypothetical protein
MHNRSENGRVAKVSQAPTLFTINQGMEEQNRQNGRSKWPSAAWDCKRRVREVKQRHRKLEASTYLIPKNYEIYVLLLLLIERSRRADSLSESSCFVWVPSDSCVSVHKPACQWLGYGQWEFVLNLGVTVLWETLHGPKVSAVGPAGPTGRRF